MSVNGMERDAARDVLKWAARRKSASLEDLRRIGEEIANSPLRALIVYGREDRPPCNQ